MTKFLDDTARILAGPMPRRRALKFIGGVLFGGLLAMLPGCCTASHCTKSGQTSYCVTNNVCCSDGTTLLCGGLCYSLSSGSCPSNLPQQSLCGPECK